MEERMNDVIKKLEQRLEHKVGKVIAKQMDQHIHEKKKTKNS